MPTPTIYTNQALIDFLHIFESRDERHKQRILARLPKTTIGSLIHTLSRSLRSPTDNTKPEVTQPRKTPRKPT